MAKTIEFRNGNLYVDGKAKYCPVSDVFKHCNIYCAGLGYDVAEDGERREPLPDIEPDCCDGRCGVADYSCSYAKMIGGGWLCTYHGTHKTITVKTCMQTFEAKAVQRDGCPDVFFWA